jgi:hypothetical protein
MRRAGAGPSQAGCSCLTAKDSSLPGRPDGCNLGEWNEHMFDVKGS